MKNIFVLTILTILMSQGAIADSKDSDDPCELASKSLKRANKIYRHAMKDQRKICKVALYTPECDLATDTVVSKLHIIGVARIEIRNTCIVGPASGGGTGDL